MREKQGQTLVEIVFVISVIFLVLTGLVGGMIFAVRAVRYARNKAEATRVAKKKLEELKAKKQDSAFWDGYPGSCSEDSWIEGAGGTKFWYKIDCDTKSCSGNRCSAAVTISVWWGSTTMPAGKNQVILDTIISNWER